MGPVSPRSRRSAIIDVAVIVGVFIALRTLLGAVGVPFAGPATVAGSVVIALCVLRWRGESLAAVGLARPKSVVAAIALNVATVIAIAVVFLFVLEPGLRALGIAPAEGHSFEYLVGNPVALLLTLVLVAWGTAAVGEEILARGFVLNRIADALGGSRGAVVAALLLQAVLFGLAHAAQGAHGMIASGVIALILGGAYVAGRRNLWCVMPAHGIVDTISLIQVYGSGS